MTRSYPDLYILRHGQTEWNASGRMQGALDSPLTEKGRGQAADLGVLLAREDALALPAFVSPQGRAAETARIALAAASGPCTTDARLREISLGDCDGLTRAEINARWPGLADLDDPWHLYTHSPKAEPLWDVHARVQSFLDDLTGPAILVTHGVVSLVMRTILLGLPMEEFWTLPGGQGVIYRVRDGRQTKLAM